MKPPVPIIAVIGPTASGKTDVGLKLAREIGGEIISVDSMQIYRWMDIGTAKPPLEMRKAVPHHLIDITNPDQTYNAGRFVEDADAVIDRLQHQRRPAILLGGTHLYLKSLIHGIIPIPEVSPETKEKVRRLAAQEGSPACHARLAELDPASAEKLHPNDVSRVSRALAVVLETGKSIAASQQHHHFNQRRYRPFYIAVGWQRHQLYERINQRVRRMVTEGLVEEAESLLWRGYSTDLPPLQAIGYKQAFAYLNDEINQTEMIADIQQKSRRYAKKQLTWIRRMPDICWLVENRLTGSVLDRTRRHLDSG